MNEPWSKGISDEEMIKTAKANKTKKTVRLAVLSAGSVLVFLLIWLAAVESGLLPRKYLSTPIEIVKLFFLKLTQTAPDGATLEVHILSSLQIALTGFTAALVIGIPLGLLMGWYKALNSFVNPIFEIIRPIPPVSWIPLTIVWLGIGLPAKSFIVFFAAFIPCVINSYTGIRQTNPTLINMSKAYGATNFEIFYKIGVPSASKMIFAGVRVALGNAWSTLVAAEMLAASSGLGYMILMGRQFTRPDIIILGIVTIGAIGTLFNWLLSVIERKFTGWNKL